MAALGEPEWVDAAVAEARADDHLASAWQNFDGTIVFDFGGAAFAITIATGRIEEVSTTEFSESDFALRAPADVWDKLLSPSPPPMYQDVFSVWLQTRELTIEGDIRLALRHVRAVKRLLDIFRRVEHGEPPDSDYAIPDDFDHGEEEAIDAGFVWLEHDGNKYRTYYETAGNGDVPLVCLHTASGDSRQWRHLLNDRELLEDFTIYAFDMPWHGQTYPPQDTAWWQSTFQLTSTFYVGFVMTFIDALDLVDPVVLGCSMGGCIVLPLAVEHEDDLRAVIGLEAADRPDEAHRTGTGIRSETSRHDVAKRYHTDPAIDQEVLRPEWTYALQAPQSPEKGKRESWWIYSQGGHRVYVGDLNVVTDFDVTDDLSDIDTDACGVYLLTGEYDFSVTAEQTRETGRKIDGAVVEIMEEMGHFPTTENPELFAEYLSPVLEDILEST